MTTAVELAHLVYQYAGEDQERALNDLSFQIEEGEWVAIVGPNGSGKSTSAKAINGLIAPLKGEVKIFDTLLTEENLWALRRQVGMVFQNPDNQFVGATVEDDVAFGLENQGIPRAEMVARVTDALAKVRMTDFAKREPARLSGGQKQRVAIAGVVALRPKIIILDEATSMLDPKGRKEVIETIRQIKEEAQLTVISITHDIDEAAHANRVLVIKDGAVALEGKPEKIFSYGEELIELGLDLPFPEKLKAALKKRGISVPQEYLTTERMAEWLWTSLSKK